MRQLRLTYNLFVPSSDNSTWRSRHLTTCNPPQPGSPTAIPQTDLTNVINITDKSQSYFKQNNPTFCNPHENHTQATPDQLTPTSSSTPPDKLIPTSNQPTDHSKSPPERSNNPKPTLNRVCNNPPYFNPGDRLQTT